jgi:hypothetical protein
MGSGLLRQALQSLDSLGDSAFVDSSEVLAVSSFSALARFVLQPAVKCDPALGIHLSTDRVRARMQREKEAANSNVSLARGTIDRNPDRAAQLLAGAIAAGEPYQLDLSAVIRCLSELREPAPELADELFEEALAFTARTGAPHPGFLGELGKYLFTSEKLLDYPDREQRNDTLTIAGSSVTDFRENRHSANSDAQLAYLESLKLMYNDQVAWARDPVLSYAIVHQILPVIGNIAPDDLARFERIQNELALNAAAGAAQVNAQLTPEEGVPLEGINPALRRDRLIAKFRTEWSSGRLDRAAELMSRIDDQVVRSQLDGLMRWGQVLAAMRQKNFDRAMSLAHVFQPGARRALLYTSIAGVTKDRVLAQEAVKLAWRDVEPMPAEQRAYLLMPIAARMFDLGQDTAYTVLGQVVTAFNDARTRPRRFRFNARAERTLFNANKDPNLEGNILIRNGRGVSEALDSGRSRFSFPLQPPGVDAFDLPKLVQYAKTADTERIESVLLQLRNEAKLVSALVACALRDLEENSRN